MNATKQATRKGMAAPKGMPLHVGSASLPDRGVAPAALELEIRVKLTPTEARLLRCLPIVGACVRQWRVPISAGDWRPHPTMPGAEIQFGAV
jgi:hypothetical protein